MAGVTARLVGVGVLAAVIGFVLPVTVHGDFRISNFNTSLVLTDHPNLYQAVADGPAAVFPTGLSGAPYGPLFYYPTAAWLGALDVAGALDIRAWDGPDDPALQSFADLLVLKLPNLVLYALAAVVLARVWGGARGEAASWLWLANPAVVLFALMMGQNDGWTALATLAALWFALRAVDGEPFRLAGRSPPPAPLSMLALAVGAAIKLSPVLMIAPAAWLLGRDLRGRVALAAAGFGAFALFIAPFLGTDYFWDHGLFGRQQGQQPDLHPAVLGTIYAAYLAVVALAARLDGDRPRVLLMSFLLLHALLYLLPPWSPQRSVLYLAVLAAAVPLWRVFVVPYLLVTAVALVLALEHGNDIATRLFAPLSDDVFLIGAVASAELEPLTSVLYVLGALAWLGAIATLWLRAPVVLPSLRWPAAAMTLLLIGGLGVFFGATFAQLRGGIDSTPYRVEAAPVRLDEGETLLLAFASPDDGLHGVSLYVEEGSTDALVRAIDHDGTVLYEQERALPPGELRIDLGRVDEAGGRIFRVDVVARGPVTLTAAELPEGLVAVAVEIEGRPLDGVVPRYTLHHQTTWISLRDGVRSQLGDGWRVLVLSGALAGVVVGASVWAASTGESRARNAGSRH